jgi:hypothetical protein
MATVFPCTFFNTPEGCKFSAEECKRPHVNWCTHSGCRRSKINRTHTADNCRNKGADIVEKPLKTRLGEAKTAVCERIFVLVEKILKTHITSKSNPTSGKVTGMLYEAMSLRDLTEVLSNEEFLIKTVQEAVDVLDAHAALST